MPKKGPSRNQPLVKPYFLVFSVFVLRVFAGTSTSSTFSLALRLFFCLSSLALAFFLAWARRKLGHIMSESNVKCQKNRNYFTSSDPHHDISWYIFWHTFCHSIWHIFQHFIWYIFLAFYLAYILAFYVAFFLAYILAFYVAFYVAYILAVYPAYILAFHLAAEVQRCPLELGRSQVEVLRCPLGSGAHCAQNLAVEVQPCPLRSEAGS